VECWYVILNRSNGAYVLTDYPISNLQRDICTLGKGLKRTRRLNSTPSDSIMWILSKFFIIRRPVKKLRQCGMGRQIESTVDIIKVRFELTFVLNTRKKAGEM
jgi:hypothetical protein